MGMDTAAQAFAVIGPSVAGTQAVYVSGVIVVALLAFARTWAESLVTVVHEGGHIVIGILTFRKPTTFHVDETTGGGATRLDTSWGAGAILAALAGYLAPPLVGLGGAALVLAGKSWSLLWAALFLLLGAFLKAADTFTRLIVLLAGVGIGWILAKGGPALQAGVAVALVWLMLIGGVTTLVGQGFGVDTSDAAVLSGYTLIPRVLWVGLFWFVAILCLWVGARRLTGL